MSTGTEYERATRVAGATHHPPTTRSLLNPFDPETDATLLDAAQALCRGYMADERDGYYPLSDHHGEWLTLLDEHRKLVLNCHRDGLKTTVTLAYLILRLEYDPGFKAVWAMNNQGLTTKKADTEFNRMVTRNPWLTELNATRERDTVTAKEFANGSTLYASWLDGGIDGDRAHLLVLDDLVKARGDGDLDAIREWVEGTCVPMVKDRGRTVILGTRKGRNDIYAHYRTLPAYEVVEYPAVLDVWDRQHNTDGVHSRRPNPDYYTDVSDPWSDNSDATLSVLWPEARGPEWLAGKRDEMSDYRFWREYCLSFIGGSGNLVSPADVNKLTADGGCSIRDESPPRERRAGEGEAIIVAYDPAQSPTGDNQAFTSWLFGRDGRRTLLDARTEQGLPPSQVKAELADLDRRFDPAAVGIESNGMQSYIENDAVEFSAELRAKVSGHATTGKKHSWENGIPQLRNLVESGSIQFYRGHDGTEDFITAAQSLELRDGKLRGHTPDLIASWHIAEQVHRELNAEDEPDAPAPSLHRH